MVRFRGSSEWVLWLVDRTCTLFDVDPCLEFRLSKLIELRDPCSEPLGGDIGVMLGDMDSSLFFMG